MKNLNNVFIIVIVALMGIIAVQTCTLKNDDPKQIVKIEKQKYEVIKREVDTVFVNKIKTKYIKGSDIYHEVVVEKEVKVPFYIKDTVLIVQEYLTKNVYKDKLVLDNNLGTIDIIDTLQYNKITGRTWNAQVRENVIHDVQYVKELPRNQVYVGINGLFNVSNKVSNNPSLLIGPSVLLKSKKDNIYGVSMYVDNSLNTYAGLNINWKIKFKK